MKISITQRLFLAIALAAVMAVVSMVLIMQWSVQQGFLRYVNTMEKGGVSRLASSLEEGYRRETSWDFVLHYPAQWHRLVIASMPGNVPPPPPGTLPDPAQKPVLGESPSPRPLPPRLAHYFAQHLFLLDADKKMLISRIEVPADSEATPLFHDGKIVGYLGLLPRKELSEPHQQRFLREQTMAFAMVAGIVLLLATGLSLLLSRRLVRPLRSLAEATHHLAAGKFSTRVEVISNDELGQLAGNFNLLATTLEKNEQARRQWVADISHELRTPVSILRGEIEALQDGIRQPGPDSLRSLHNEALRLARLVDDLYQLAMSDLGALTYRKEKLNLTGVLQETVASYVTEFSAKGITIATNLPPENSATIFGDTERLRQLFANLLNNSLKYTDTAGELRIDITCDERTMTIDFQDSAPGVTEADMERLFERLYRVEASRNRATGGAGLGLAICRNIVEAHQGKILVRHSALGGLWVQVELPLAEGK